MIDISVAFDLEDAFFIQNTGILADIEDGTMIIFSDIFLEEMILNCRDIFSSPNKLKDTIKQ